MTASLFKNFPVRFIDLPVGVKSDEVLAVVLFPLFSLLFAVYLNRFVIERYRDEDRFRGRLCLPLSKSST